MFFIVFFGTRQVVHDADGAGEYLQCPRCGQYALFRPRLTCTWLHIFWLPVLPLGSATPLRECGNCKLRLATAA